jgi:Zn-dependent peptidase ImmA (M78 family)
MPKVNPAILRWARETAGLSPDQAVRRISLNDARCIPAVQRLMALERGELDVTRPLLLRMAKAYRRPLLTFYLSEPPGQAVRVGDFRSIPEPEIGTEALVDTLVRDIRARQEMVRSILEEDEDIRPLEFVGSITMARGVETVLWSMRQTLRISIDEFRAQRTAEGAFAYLRAKAEDEGGFVLLVGNLGSHHTDISVEAFRGFALADNFAPFVVINDKDAKSAWSFTLLHELAHLWIGATGVSGTSVESRIERFSSDVASAFLLPEQELRQIDVDQASSPEDIAREIGDFAQPRLASRALVVYRLWRADKISEPMYRTLSARFRAEWRASRDEQRACDRGRSGGPDYYVVRRHRLGGALINFVSRALDDGSITPTKAGKVLGVRPRSVATLIQVTLCDALSHRCQRPDYGS